MEMKNIIICLMDTASEESVLPIWVADMDFCTAPTVVEALRRREEYRLDRN